MLFTFNFQMFNDEIPGIDADVLEQFKDELPQEEPAKQQEQEPEQQEEAAHADHHSDNKDVEPTTEEQQTEEEEEVPEGSNVPYNRFKGVNERMKAAEARQRELEAELAKYKNQPQQQEQQASPAPAAPQNVGDLNAEQIKIMTNEARRRAAKQLNLSAEDIENMEYSDDPDMKASYDALTVQHMNDVRKEVADYQQKQQAYMDDIQTTHAEYASEAEKFNADPEYAAKWDKVCKAAQQRGKRFMAAAQGAIDRLNAGRGTSGDYFFVKDFMDSVLSDWPAPAAKPTSKTNKKIQEAAKLPTAPSVSGATKGDVVWDVPTITDYINSGRMDKIPGDVLSQIMGQKIKKGE